MVTPRVVCDDPWGRSCFRDVAALLSDESRRTTTPPTRAELSGWLAALPEAGPRWALAPNPPRRRRPAGLDETYDGQVCGGNVPTRDACWHDVFNVAAFALFPATKAAIHRRQLDELVRQEARGWPPRGVRPRARDHLTLLDEGGVLLATDEGTLPECWRALDAGDLAALSELARAGRATPWVLGHALLEHAMRTLLGEALGPPPRGLTLPVSVASASAPRQEVDARFAEGLASADELEPPQHAGVPLTVWFEDLLA